MIRRDSQDKGPSLRCLHLRAQEAEHGEALTGLLNIGLRFGMSSLGLLIGRERRVQHGKSIHSLAAGRSVHAARHPLAPRCLSIRRRMHGLLVWEVEAVTAENKVMEVHIDAGTGAVIDVEEEKPEQDMKRERKGGYQP